MVRDKFLSEYLDQKKNAPFVWGENDCILFAAKFVKKVTGIDFYSYYGPYSSQEEAEAIIKKHCSVYDMIYKALGEPKDSYLYASRGDVVLMQLASGDTLGIVDTTGKRVAAVSERGLVRLPLRKASFVWGF